MNPFWKKLLWTLALLVIAAGAANYFARSFYGIQYVSVRQPEVFRFLRHEEVLHPVAGGGSPVAIRHAVFAFRFSGKKPIKLLHWPIRGSSETRPSTLLYYTDKQLSSGWQRPLGYDCLMGAAYTQLQPNTDYELLARPVGSGDLTAGAQIYACLDGESCIYRSEPLTIPQDPR